MRGLIREVVRRAGQTFAQQRPSCKPVRRRRVTRPGRRGATKRQRGVSPFDVMAAALPWLVMFELDEQYHKRIRLHRRRLPKMSLALLSGLFLANRLKGMEDPRLARSTV